MSMGRPTWSTRAIASATPSVRKSSIITATFAIVASASATELDVLRKQKPVGAMRQRHDRNVQLLGQRLEAGGDLGHLLDAAFVGLALRARQQLDVVDDQDVEAFLALEPARARTKLGDRQAAGLVDVERQGLQLN